MREYSNVQVSHAYLNVGCADDAVPGCGSTFTRHFNLKGHLRSHNDERPYKCPYEGCPKGQCRMRKRAPLMDSNNRVRPTA